MARDRVGEGSHRIDQFRRAAGIRQQREGDVTVRFACGLDQSRDVAGDVASGRQEVGQYDDLVDAARHTVGDALGGAGLGELQEHRLHAVEAVAQFLGEIGGEIDDDAIGVVVTAAVGDEEECAHVRLLA